MWWFKITQFILQIWGPKSQEVVLVWKLRCQQDWFFLWAPGEHPFCILSLPPHHSSLCSQTSHQPLYWLLLPPSYKDPSDHIEVHPDNEDTLLISGPLSNPQSPFCCVKWHSGVLKIRMWNVDIFRGHYSSPTSFDCIQMTAFWSVLENKKWLGWRLSSQGFCLENWWASCWGRVGGAA